MLCREALPLLSPQIDAELSANSSDTLEAHLLVCVSCRSRRHHLLAARGAILSLPEPALPEGFAGHLAARLSLESRPSPMPSANRTAWRWRWAAAAAMALALLGIVRPWSTRLPTEPVAVTASWLAVDCGLATAAMCRDAWACLSAATCGPALPPGLRTIRRP